MKCLLIINPVSGKKKKFNLKYIIDTLKIKFDVVDFLQSKYRNHVTEILNEKANDYDTVIVKGGDGTLNEAINALSNFENPPALGYIPSGTTNDVGKTFGLSKNIKKALKVILNGNIITTDILQVNDRKAMYVCGVGMFTRSSYATSQTKKQKFGRLAYIFAGIKEFFSSKTVNITLNADGQEYSGDCALGLCLNSKWVGGFKLNNFAELNDGKMDLCFVFEKKPRKKVCFATKLKICTLFLFGLHKAKPNKKVVILKTDKCNLKINSTDNATVDGECCSEKDLTIKVLKSKIKLYAKKNKNNN